LRIEIYGNDHTSIAIAYNSLLKYEPHKLITSMQTYWIWKFKRLILVLS